MKRIYTILVTALFMFALNITNGRAQYPGSGQVPLDPTTIPQFVDFLPHFAGLRVNAKAGGNLIIEAVKTQQVAVSTGTLLDNGTVGTTPGAGLGNYFAYRISKDGNSWFGPLWPAFTIEAQRGNKLNIELRNKLNGLTYKDVNIAADQTVMMSGVPTTGDPMSDPYTGPIPIAMHLHGGEVQSTSDGGPDAWFTPDYFIERKRMGQWCRDCSSLSQFSGVCNIMVS
jgi:spore coat protein A